MRYGGLPPTKPPGPRPLPDPGSVVPVNHRREGRGLGGCVPAQVTELGTHITGTRGMEAGWRERPTDR